MLSGRRVAGFEYIIMDILTLLYVIDSRMRGVLARATWPVASHRVLNAR